MQPYSFLAALPAVLALAGFVVYQLVGANKSGDEISRRIVDKLRATAPDELPPDQRLTAKQVERLLEHRQRLKKIVGEQDFLLLRQALSQQFVTTVVVYVLTLAFCAWSTYLFMRSPSDSKSATPAIVQKSSGNASPNIVSTGQGNTNVQIEPSKTPAASKTAEPKK